MLTSKNKNKKQNKNLHLIITMIDNIMFNFVEQPIFLKT